MTERQLTRFEAAGFVLGILEQKGAIATLRGVDDDIHVNLDGIIDFGTMTPDVWAQLILGLRHEIRRVLIGRRVTH